MIATTPLGRVLEEAFLDERSYEGSSFVAAVEQELEVDLTSTQLAQMAAGYERLSAELRAIASSRL